MGGKQSKPIVVNLTDVSELEHALKEAEILYSKKQHQTKMNKRNNKPDPAEETVPPPPTANPFFRAVDFDGDSFILSAVRRKDVPFVTMLLEHGAPLDITDRYTNAGLLAVAIESGCPEMVKLLAQHGAPWVLDKSRRSPLHMALLAGPESDPMKDEIVRFVLDCYCFNNCSGASSAKIIPRASPPPPMSSPSPSPILPPRPTTPPPTPTPEAIAAAEAKQQQEQQQLKQQQQQQQQQQPNNSTSPTPPLTPTTTVAPANSPPPPPAGGAASNQQQQQQQQLASLPIQKPPALRLMERMEDGNTPLHLALKLGNIGWAKEILKVREGALNVFTADSSTGNTPLLQAISTCPEAVQYFLNMGAPVNVTNKSGNTPLHLAAMKGNFDVVSKLLAAQSVVSARNAAGNSVLHEIVRAKSPIALVHTILDAAPENASIRNAAGQTAMDIAKEIGFEEAATLLESVTRPPQDSDKQFKIQFISDIHLEFGTKPDIIPAAPYLALLGDTGLLSTEGNCLQTTSDFLLGIAEKFERVFVVMGNHEHYKNNYAQAQAAMEEICSKNPKLVLMNNKSEVHDGVRIVGTTLWTEVPDRYAPEIKKCLSDYKAIKYEDGELTTDHTTKFHKDAVEYIKSEIALAKEAKEKVVILSHHGPLLGLGCGSPDTWAQAVKFAFGTDLKYLMNPPVAGWLYGHTHWWHDMSFNGTRVMNNPHGYPKENIDYLKSCVFSCLI